MGGYRFAPSILVVFLACWGGIWLYSLLTSSTGMSCPAVLLHIAATIIAGGLVGWWRFPVREGLFVEGHRLADGPLAGALVSIATVTVVFVVDALRRFRADRFDLADAPELILSWMGACAILATISLVLGLAGSLTGFAIASAVKRWR